MDPVSLQLGTNHLWSWLVSLLSKDPEWLNAKVKFFLPKMDLSSRNKAEDATQGIMLQLSRLHTQDQATWQAFIHCVCMELDVPLDLEVPLLSTWGHGDGWPSQLGAGEESQPESQLHHGLKRPHQSCGSSPRPKQCKKQQVELARSYLQLLRTSTQQRYGNRMPGPGQPLALQQAYIPPILQWSRATAPFNTQEGAILGNSTAEDYSDASLRDLFNTKADKGPKVTVLLGKAGMGKTTLAHRLCQKWADGQLDRFQALFLFEFRQLNLITRFLTLPQLLFDLYLSPESGTDSVFNYLEQNANGILLIFDGLDQALHLHSTKDTEDPEAPSPALALFSGLCKGTLLPGCWVLTTSRPGKLPDCLPTEAVMVHMWGFDRPRVEEYAGRFFSDQLWQEAALAELRDNRHLQSMCAVPAVCQVTCLCLYHLLPSSSPSQAAALLSTVTQNYVQMVSILGPRAPLFPESLLGLSEVALRGLETGKVIFSVGDIPPPMMAFGAAVGLLTSFCICTGPGHQDTGYAFTHLSLQEFFAALHLMASPEVDKNTLANYVTLSSRWVLRTKARLGLLDHLPTFLAGLASHACCPFLCQVAQRDEVWVGARQAKVMQALRKLATRRLTGPKVVALCHCVSETQEPELASLMAQSLPCHLSFHNFPLTYADLAALNNILGHRNSPIQLGFEGCPLEPHCSEALVGCKQVEDLSFKSRKCGDAFAEALSRSLPTMGRLKKLGLAGSKITSQGISRLVEALLLCPQLEEVSFQDNQLKDLVLLKIVEVLLGLPRLQKLDLSRNSVSMSTLLSLTKVAVTSPTVRMLQVREADLIFLLSPPIETAAELQGASDLQGNASQRKEAQRRNLSLRLQQCQLGAHDVQELIAQLQGGPHLDEVDLSGNQLYDEGCRLMAEATAQLHIARSLDLSDNGLTVDGAHQVLSAASTCRTLAELHISLLHKTVVLTFAPEQEEQEVIQERAALGDSLMHQSTCELSPRSTRIRLTHCGWQAKHLAQLCEALGGSCCLSHLDLSENGLSLDAVFALTQCFSTLQWLLHLDVSFESQHIVLRGDRRGRDRLAGGPLPELLAGALFLASDLRCVPRSFCLQQCLLEPQSLTHLCDALEKCPGPLEVKLSCEALSDQSLETLLTRLPWLPQLSLLQLSETTLSPRSPLLLANLFSLCPRIQKVDLRSLNHTTLHFRSSEEQKGEYCGRFTDCGLTREHVEQLCWLLSECEDLSQLDLSANLLRDDGLRCLLECLPQLPISGSLDLSHNSISVEGALCLVKALPSCPRVREASVSLGSEQSFWVHFSRQEEAGKTLRLSQCGFRPEHLPRLAASLNQAPELTALTLTQCCLGLEQLTVLLSLVRWPLGLLNLRVEEPWVGKAGVLALLQVCTQTSGNITELSISESQHQLCLQLEFPRQENPEAVALRLAHCDLGTQHNLLVCQLMETCARLRRLSLSLVSLCDTSSLLLQSLLPSLSELKTFRLTCSCVSSQGLSHLTSGLNHCPHLEELDLSNNQLGEEGTTVLMGVLEGKCWLKRLDLSHLPLGSSTLAMLTQRLSHRTLLQSLRLSHNQIGDTGAQHLAAVLLALPELRKIDLSGNGIGPAGGARLAESLTLCRNLEELMLGCNALGDATALQLAWGLPRHLKVLHLPSSRLGPKGALSLIQALDGCQYVEEISLAENSLARGFPQFCQGLPLLRRIDLVSCEMDDHTAKPLAASLLLCPALEEILLSWNLLGDEAAAKLAGILPQMGRLKRMDLEKNRITACGARLLAEGLAQGSGIQVIRLWSNPISPNMVQRLQSQEPRLDFAFFDKQPKAPWGT
ncbi:protein NLRC5 [Suricata suricatta]|uniref:protein NLRC5 n=1 Tax=Suricata suricatta TaxID=37032 RepID=UPI0011559306|nr:protein NLRC5 [Suricata suricatta]